MTRYSEPTTLIPGVQKRAQNSTKQRLLNNLAVKNVTLLIPGSYLSKNMVLDERT